MTDDIVARLREEGFITHMAKLPRESKLLHASADEIERLRNDRDGSQLAYRGASYDRDRMRAERDESRRWLRDACAEIARIETRFYDAVTPQQIAERNGWDCYRGEASNER
jgi:hypothetical protein